MSILTDITERLRALIFHSREERDLDEELRTHLAMEAEYLRRTGASDERARRASAIALGGAERVKDDVRDARGTRLLHDVWRDVGFAVRTLVASPGFTLVTLATLAIGIGGTTAVFSTVDAVLLEPLPYAQPGELVRLYQHRDDKPNERSVVTPVHFVEIRRRMTAFAATAALNLYRESGADIGSGDRVERIRTVATTVDYWDVLHIHPEIGRGFTPDEQIGSDVAVISHDLWRDRLGGDRNAIGHTLTMNGRPVTIVGIMPAGFRDPLVGRVDALVPLDLRPANDPSNAGNFYLTVLARLRPGISVQRAQAELDAVNLAIAEKYANAKRMRASIYSLKEDIVGASTRALALMFGAVLLVLVLVCVNVANLMLVRGSDRAHELAIRVALGAERWRLVRQMLIESLTLAIAGAAAGLVVARVAMSAIVALGADTIPRLTSLTLEPRLLAFAFIVATISAVGFGLAPAIRASRTQPTDALRDHSRGSTGGARNLRLREWLVVSQVALAFMLLVGAGLLISSLDRLEHVDLGVKTANVLTFDLNLPDARYDSTARGLTYERVARTLEALPGVRAAGGVSKLPGTGPYNTWGAHPLSGPLAGDDNLWPNDENRVVSGDYFRAVGIPIVRGRAFDDRDVPGAQPTMVITQSLADKIFPGVDPIGQSLTTGGRKGTVVGIAGETSITNEGTPGMFVYHPHRQFAADRNWALTQVVAVNSPALLNGTIQRAVRAAIAAIDPLLVVYHPATLDEDVGRGAAQRLFTLRILGAFAVVALILAALGLFGVLSYGVRLRGREFGIRMALGAQRSSIRVMVLGQGLIVSGIGIAIGLTLAAGLSRFMRSMLFEVSPLNPIVFGGAVGFMVVIAALSAYLPAHRATSTDPRSALQ
ncbi:MAG TPA: ABC transporter permease [Gemmatimonadaceae bacterium]|nr:ABC transporter permease [Gemmatimonadaceae bacterium]